MSTAGGIVTYILMWWLFFFMALPFGSRPPEVVEKGHATSAPEKPRLWIKAAVATLLAAAATWGVAQLIASGLISLRPAGPVG
ncbi:MAG: DUF1467 family protein [Geminicoccaceae bacterium]|nr:DUF1467 family protein [Geminicoccaceae bacterium]MCB9944100.1 DUF1467 family protein [Geminicoccaceae bacterium]